jgi:hypothetical protein
MEPVVSAAQLCSIHCVIFFALTQSHPIATYHLGQILVQFRPEAFTMETGDRFFLSLYILSKQ